MIETALSNDFLEQIRNQARAVSPNIWRPAVRQLVEYSGYSPRSLELMRELILSREPELRYRGVVGLQSAATVVPEVLAEFIQDRWEEPETWEDPVLLEALAQAAERLPQSQLQPLLERVWREGPEALRCSTIPLLWKAAAERGGEALLPALEDPSPGVRAHLALDSCERLQDRAETWEALARLSQDRDPEVRAAVAVGLTSPVMADHPEAQPILARLEQDEDEGVRRLLFTAPPTPSSAEGPDTTTRALLLAAELDDQPDQLLETLGPWLGQAGGWQNLQAVAEFACHPQVAQGARALAALCHPEAPPAERFLRCLGNLRTAPGGGLTELKHMAKLCLQVVEQESFVGLCDWAASRPHPPRSAHPALPCRELYQALWMVEQASPDSVAPALTAAAALRQAEELGRKAASAPGCEPYLMVPTLEHVAALLQRDLEQASQGEGEEEESQI